MRTNPDPAAATSVHTQARLVRRATTALAARARVERGGILTLNEVAVLGRLVRNGSPTAGEVAQQLGAQPQSLTRTFNALESAGLMARTTDPGDGRQFILTITTAGRKALRDEMRPRDNWMARAMGECLTPDERELLVAAAPLLERLSDLPPDNGPKRETR